MEFYTLPPEIQNYIIDCCDTHDLTLLARLNAEWYERIMPIIWDTIDFPAIDSDQVDTSVRFLSLCDSLMNEAPDRWPSLAARVRKLNLGRIHGVDIAPEGQWGGDDWTFFDGHSGEDGNRNVFDIIATFRNLDTLVVYVKNWWDGQPNLKATGKALGEGLTKLKVLRTGGQLS